MHACMLQTTEQSSISRSVGPLHCSMRCLNALLRKLPKGTRWINKSLGAWVCVCPDSSQPYHPHHSLTNRANQPTSGTHGKPRRRGPAQHHNRGDNIVCRKRETMHQTTFPGTVADGNANAGKQKPLVHMPPAWPGPTWPDVAKLLRGNNPSVARNSPLRVAGVLLFAIVTNVPHVAVSGLALPPLSLTP